MLLHGGQPRRNALGRFNSFETTPATAAPPVIAFRQPGNQPRQERPLIAAPQSIVGGWRVVLGRRPLVLRLRVTIPAARDNVEKA
jgi:hypothetical protein